MTLTQSFGSTPLMKRWESSTRGVRFCLTVVHYYELDGEFLCFAQLKDRLVHAHGCPEFDLGSGLRRGIAPPR